MVQIGTKTIVMGTGLLLVLLYYHRGSGVLLLLYYYRRTGLLLLLYFHMATGQLLLLDYLVSVNIVKVTA